MRYLNSFWMFGPGVVVLGMVAGCGGSASDSDSRSGSGPRHPACSREGCGGDIIGTWQIDELCELDMGSLEVEGCPNITIDARGLSAAGSMTFGTDGSATQSVTLTGSLTMVLPEECITFEGVTLSCDQLEQAAQSDLLDADAAGEPSEFSGVSCSGSGDCRCRFELEPQTQLDTGTYSTSGSVVTTWDENGDQTDNIYCVEGDTLTLRQEANEESGSGVIVLTR